MHAAMSRDYGITREVFLQHMQTDLQAIQQFPPQLRWFVQDNDDEALLIQAAQTVFDTPREPETHQSDFLTVCVERVGRSARRRRRPSRAERERRRSSAGLYRQLIVAFRAAGPGLLHCSSRLPPYALPLRSNMFYIRLRKLSRLFGDTRRLSRDP